MTLLASSGSPQQRSGRDMIPEQSAATVVVDMLLHDAGLYGKHRAMVAELEATANRLDPEFAARLAPYMQWMLRAGHASDYALIYLLGELRHAEPAAADRAARYLVRAWDQGTGMDTQLNLWASENAAGLPLTRPAGVVGGAA